jgi:hypothetical protein
MSAGSSQHRSSTASTTHRQAVVVYTVPVPAAAIQGSRLPAGPRRRAQGTQQGASLHRRCCCGDVTHGPGCCCSQHRLRTAQVATRPSPTLLLHSLPTVLLTQPGRQQQLLSSPRAQMLTQGSPMPLLVIHPHHRHCRSLANACLPHTSATTPHTPPRPPVAHTLRGVAATLTPPGARRQQRPVRCCSCRA